MEESWAYKDKRPGHISLLCPIINCTQQDRYTSSLKSNLNMLSLSKQFAFLLFFCGLLQAVTAIVPCGTVPIGLVNNEKQDSYRLDDFSHAQYDWRTKSDGSGGIIRKEDDNGNVIVSAGSQTLRHNWIRVEHDRHDGNKVSATPWYYLDRDVPCYINLPYWRVAGGQLYRWRD